MTDDIIIIISSEPSNFPTPPLIPYSGCAGETPAMVNQPNSDYSGCAGKTPAFYQPPPKRSCVNNSYADPRLLPLISDSSTIRGYFDTSTSTYKWIWVKNTPDSRGSVWKIVCIQSGKVVAYAKKYPKSDKAILDEANRYTNMAPPVKKLFVRFMGLFTEKPDFDYLFTEDAGPAFVHIHELASGGLTIDALLPSLISALAILHYNNFLHGDLHSGNYKINPETKEVKFLDPNTADENVYVDMCQLKLTYTANRDFIIRMFDVMLSITCACMYIKSGQKPEDRAATSTRFIYSNYGWNLNIRSAKWTKKNWHVEAVHSVCAYLNQNKP